jgi:hypothetical protein
MRVEFLGTGGYHPNERRHTACVLLPEIGLAFDAGTSVFRLPPRLESKELDVFLSHAHLDHIAGLTGELAMRLGRVGGAALLPEADGGDPAAMGVERIDAGEEAFARHHEHTLGPVEEQMLDQDRAALAKGGCGHFGLLEFGRLSAWLPGVRDAHCRAGGGRCGSMTHHISSSSANGRSTARRRA